MNLILIDFVVCFSNKTNAASSSPQVEYNNYYCFVDILVLKIKI